MNFTVKGWGKQIYVRQPLKERNNEQDNLNNARRQHHIILQSMNLHFITLEENKNERNMERRPYI